MTTTTLTGYRPSARLDDQPWTGARVEAATAAIGPWETVGTFSLLPVDADPAEPVARSFAVGIGPGLRWVRVVFTDAGGDEQPTAARTIGTYPSAAELASMSGVPELDTLPEARLEQMRLAAINAVEGYCNQSFDLYEGALRVDGTGSRTLPLPRRLLALEGVHGAGFTAADLTVMPGDAELVLPQEWGGNYYEQASRRFDGARPWWPRGTGNISLVGRWGWEEVPDEIVMAVAVDMGEQARGVSAPLAASVDAYRALGLRQIAQGNLSFTLGQSPSELSPRAVRMVPDRFVWTSAGGGVA